MNHGLTPQATPVIATGMLRAPWEDFECRFAVKILAWYAAVDAGLAFKPIGVGPIGSLGKPLPSMEMQIVDERKRPMPAAASPAWPQ
jgi:crotonobetaine/carnitine-CoA ligase